MTVGDSSASAGQCHPLSTTGILSPLTRPLPCKIGFTFCLYRKTFGFFFLKGATSNPLQRSTLLGVLPQRKPRLQIRSAEKRTSSLPLAWCSSCRTGNNLRRLLNAHASVSLEGCVPLRPRPSQSAPGFFPNATVGWEKLVFTRAEYLVGSYRHQLLLSKGAFSIHAFRLLFPFQVSSRTKKEVIKGQLLIWWGER